MPTLQARMVIDRRRVKELSLNPNRGLFRVFLDGLDTPLKADKSASPHECLKRLPGAALQAVGKVSIRPARERSRARLGTCP